MDGRGTDIGEAPARVLRVLVVDDHTLVRQGIRALLQAETDLRVVGEGSNGYEAVRLARELKPDVVVMDLSMPGMDGLEATRLIKVSDPMVQILALTMHDSDEYFFRVLQAGASGYVLKHAASTDLLAAIRATARGEAFLYPTVAKKLVGDYLRRAQAAGEGEAQKSYAGLTAREREILMLVAEGLSNREIAVRLTLSLSTVQTHYAHIMEKLGLEKRAELTKYAIRHGLIDLES